MKILFVCWANVGRSQMAKAYYNHLTHSTDAESAGTEVELPGETLGERRSRRGRTHVIDSMSEDGINISTHTKTQLTKEMLDKYDLIISMADHQYTPDWLMNHSRFRYWHIDDPGGKAIKDTNVARDAIKSKVLDLIKEINS